MHIFNILLSNIWIFQINYTHSEHLISQINPSFSSDCTTQLSDMSICFIKLIKLKHPVRNILPLSENINLLIYQETKIMLNRADEGCYQLFVYLFKNV